ncbi:MAG: MFS transporter [Burkholderiales bacterium]
MLDFANSGYTTVVLTAVFSAYFVGVVAGGAPWAALAWTATLSVSYLLVMFTLPALGARADARARKRSLLFAASLGCIVGTLVLTRVGPGDLWLAIVAVVFSNYCYSVSDSAIASFLPELAAPQALGRVSGWGWAMGYFGGLLSLGVALAIVLAGESHGEGAPATVPRVMFATAALFAVAVIPAMLWLRERAKPSTIPVVSPLRTLARAWREIGQGFRQFRLLLLCGASYQAGISVVITLAAVYAEQVMGFTMTQTITLIFAVNIAGAFGALVFGSVQDRIGHRPALALTLVGWLFTAVTAFLAVDVRVFWVAACLAGLCMGTSQSAGRAMVGALAPSDRLASFYALWTFAMQLAAAVGPLAYGLVTWLTSGNQRLAMLLTGLFFIAALGVLSRIRFSLGEQERKAAEAHSV